MQKDRKWVFTHFAKVSYRLDRKYHIVPIKPASSYAKKWESLYGKK